MSNELTPNMLFAGRYLLKSQIGEGGIGQVWLAEDTQAEDLPVALKLPRPEYITQASFIAEAELMAGFAHDNIIKIFEMGRDEQYGEYYAMEYFSSGSLVDYLTRPECKFAKTIPGTDLRYVGLKQAIKILRPIAQALDYVHHHHPGVLHRDLKLSNILVDPQAERYVLTDFSLHVGAPSIMSPEQLLEWRGPGQHRQQLDWRSDLFAFGACLYKLTTGAYPFVVKNPPNTMQAIDEIYRYQLVDKVQVIEPRYRNPHNLDLQNERVNALIWQLTSKSRSGRTLNGQIISIEAALDMLEQSAQVKRNFFTPAAALIILAAVLFLLAAGIYAGNGASPGFGQPPAAQTATLATAANSANNDQLAGYPTFTPNAPAPETTPAPPPAEPTATTEPTAAGSPTPPPEEPTTEPSAAPAAEAPTEIPPAPTATPLQCDAGLELLNPQVNQQLTGEVVFKGVISQSDLDYYKIEFKSPGSVDWSCCLVEPTSGQINPENLGRWDTAADRFIPGEYGIRLVAVKLDGNFNICESRVTLAK